MQQARKKKKDPLGTVQITKLYMSKPESFLEEETYKNLSVFAI